MGNIFHYLKEMIFHYLSSASYYAVSIQIVELGIIIDNNLFKE